jgi:serine/threonine protein kinase
VTFQPGSSFGSYEIIAPPGAGGMGEVYRARDTRLGRDVAIKPCLSRWRPTPSVSRFRREAETLAALNHPNIATIFGLEQIDVCWRLR